MRGPLALLHSLVLALAVAFLVAMGVVATPAFAHVRSESHSVWEINGQDIDLVLTIPKIESQRLNPNKAQPDDAVLESYLLDRIYPLAGNVRCPLVPPVVVLSSTPEYRRFDFTFKCAGDKDISIHSAAFVDLVRSHTNFAQIQNAATGDFTEELITSDRSNVDVTGGEGGKLNSAGILDFIRMGIMHIFTGVDHMSFLLGLVLISRRFRDLAFVITGFTLGHSLTLALAVTGILRPHAEYIDALVALTIALIGVENIAVQARRPGLFAKWTGGALLAMAALRLGGIGLLPPLLLVGAGLFSVNYLMISGHVRDAGRLRLVVTLVFGLVHGFGFAADLLDEAIPPARLAELLVGFNLGVEVGQLTIVSLLTGSVVLLRRVKLTLPRPITVDVCASALVAVGTYWFVSRSF